MTEANSNQALKAKLNGRTIVLVGLMGCGKSSVGRRLAARLGLPFVDADDEIERAAAKSIEEIFDDYGEQYFRDGERRVIARLLGNGPQVLATGGGAFMNEETRRAISQSGVSVWLRAELPILMQRVMKREKNRRPLLRQPDPEAKMKALMDLRYPVYAEADLTIESRDAPHDNIVSEIIAALTQMPPMTPPVQPSASISDAPPAARQVRVELGDRAYDVRIGRGLIEDAGHSIKAVLGSVKCGIVTDENVARHHLKALQDSLTRAGLSHGAIVLTPGEASKSFSQLGPLCEQLLSLGLERGDIVVPFGGGVIGDLAGFAAGILRRGVRFVQLPTSLLAQVDSSVGGKTGINTAQGKNLIGVFHQPSLVLADTELLQTLPVREMRAGYAEVAKYGLLGDATFFAWLEANWQAVFAFDDAALSQAVETSVKAKADVVARDELESGDRALLNLGHTFGHALEAWTGYSDRLLHGEGVAIGMCLAFRFSETLGHCKAGAADRVSRHLNAVGLPTRINDIQGDRADARELVRLMGQDKKVRNGRLTFILARDIGATFITQDVSEAAVHDFLVAEIAR